MSFPKLFVPPPITQGISMWSRRLLKPSLGIDWADSPRVDGYVGSGNSTHALDEHGRDILISNGTLLPAAPATHRHTPHLGAAVAHSSARTRRKSTAYVQSGRVLSAYGEQGRARGHFALGVLRGACALGGSGCARSGRARRGAQHEHKHERTPARARSAGERGRIRTPSKIYAAVQRGRRHGETLNRLYSVYAVDELPEHARVALRSPLQAARASPPSPRVHARAHGPPRPLPASAPTCSAPTAPATRARIPPSPAKPN
ncbi:hypothetical protein C8F04DRAFT_1273644 [Mycena alexandri]|uniref:Uncharacterized protein n=1 Tax=Mycena alexandri TaxID=1745969 RepID=A0AAD6S9A5_9AGAR|nr:hypothetical protein C8F04DRAFT_1273644 [Mycena alexandri]